MVSQKDIAERLKLSRSLVSKVLNGRLGTTKVKPETADAIWRLARELGYRPNPSAVSLATGRQGAIGVLIRRFGTPASRLMETLTDGLCEEAGLSNQRLLLSYYGDDSGARCIELLTGSSRIDGLIFAGTVHEHTRQALSAFNSIPVVGVMSQFLGAHVSSVRANNRRIGVMAARHLIERGCRRIAQIRAWETRSAGFDEALQAAGLTLDPALCLPAEDFSHHSGEAVVHRLLTAGTDFDGLAAQSDEQAAGAINALRSRGIDVPGRVRVIGVDNAPFCEFCACPLSSVDQNLRHAGRLALRTLIQAIETPTPPVRHLEVDPILVPRESTR